MGCHFVSNYLCKRPAGYVPLPDYEMLNPAENQRLYSSIWGNDAIGTSHGRSMIDSAQAWSALRNDVHQWMTIDAGKNVLLGGLVVQTRRSSGQLVQTMKVATSSDGKHWQAVNHGKPLSTFNSPNSEDQNRIVFDSPVATRYVKIMPQVWSQHISLRAALLVKPGVEPTPSHMFNVPEDQRSYSSIWDNNAIGTWHAMSMVDSNQAWSARHNNKSQWMILDAGHDIDVTGLIVQSRSSHNYGCCGNQRVTKVGVHYRSSAMDTEKYIGDFHTHCEDNMDLHYPIVFNEPVSARWIKINPLEWNAHVSMRAAFLTTSETDVEYMTGEGKDWHEARRACL